MIGFHSFINFFIIELLLLFDMYLRKFSYFSIIINFTGKKKPVPCTWKFSLGFLMYTKCFSGSRYNLFLFLSRSCLVIFFQLSELFSKDQINKIFLLILATLKLCFLYGLLVKLVETFFTIPMPLSVLSLMFFA